jgi:hypothetical protein
MDYPYQFDIDEVIATDGIPIRDDDRKKLYQWNAEQVYALG